jgi:hypothetical protein
MVKLPVLLASGQLVLAQVVTQQNDFGARLSCLETDRRIPNLCHL